MNTNTLQIKLLIIGFIFIASNSFAQEYTLWFRDGKIKTIKNYSLTDSSYYEGQIKFTTSNGKTKTKYLEDVFSVVNKSGNEKIFYTPNENLGETLSTSQMKSYVLGRQDALNTKISPIIFIGGIVTGAAGAFIPQPEIKTNNGSFPLPLGIFVPATYVVVMGATPPTAEKLSQKFPDKAGNEPYLMGYQEGIRKKRVKNSLIGAGIGFVAGIVTLIAIN